MRFRNLVFTVVLLGGAVILYQALQPPSSPASGAAMANVTVPELSPVAQEGEAVFSRSCASCHGRNAAGQDGIAPPLIHKIYEPSHHGNAAFHLAARNGVRAHHWQFGNMPAVEGVTDPELDKIVVYIREVQQANGIF